MKSWNCLLIFRGLARIHSLPHACLDFDPCSNHDVAVFVPGFNSLAGIPFWGHPANFSLGDTGYSQPLPCSLASSNSPISAWRDTGYSQPPPYSFASSNSPVMRPGESNCYRCRYQQTPDDLPTAYYPCIGSLMVVWRFSKPTAGKLSAEAVCVQRSLCHSYLDLLGSPPEATDLAFAASDEAWKWKQGN